MSSGLEVHINGRVQGVGFRPFIFSLAKKLNLKGTVQNNLDGIRIYVEGEEAELSSFVQAIKEAPPQLSRIRDVLVSKAPIRGVTEFSIIASERLGDSSVIIPIDSSVCKDCLKEMFDPTDFRYRYPFINCTQCGPRYTIIDELPYDRVSTSMRSFSMCEKCQGEYEDPFNRRHHAQPIACPSCGPKVKLFTIDGDEVAGDPIIQTQNLLQEGAIIAIKGLGGYHLSCKASDSAVIERLRVRKNRPIRPLALMVADIQVAKEIGEVDETAVKHLESPERPIVVLNKKDSFHLPEIIAPGMNTIGVMLPYTPLHYLLLDDQLPYLVMTSANPSGQPILYEDSQAFDYLKGIADYILLNDRIILHPLDDSVVRVQKDVSFFMRRSRGFVPDPILTRSDVEGIVALGGQQKNTFALGKHNEIFLSPHIGNMDSVEVTLFHQKTFEHLTTWMGIEPNVIAVDYHPNYATTPLAKELKGQTVQVQHHHAHMVSCMTDNGIHEACFGIILDGTGYGMDHSIWGFELFHGDASSFTRIAHLKQTPLPSGEKAIYEPWRNAVGMLYALFAEQGIEWANLLFPEKKENIPVLLHLIKNQINSPLAGTCGRLFDAVSAILGVCHESTYDGEAAIRLSEFMISKVWREDEYPFELDMDSYPEQPIQLDFSSGLKLLVEDYINSVPISKIICKFHQMVVSACVGTIIEAKKIEPTLSSKVVLSGGCFHNDFLSTNIARKLKEQGFEVYTHNQVPCNDGGLALGQLMIAATKKTEMERDSYVHRCTS